MDSFLKSFASKDDTGRFNFKLPVPISRSQQLKNENTKNIKNTYLIAKKCQPKM